MPDDNFIYRNLTHALEAVYGASPALRQIGIGGATDELTEATWDRIKSGDQKKVLEWLNLVREYAAGQARARLPGVPEIGKGKDYALAIGKALSLVRQDVEELRATASHSLAHPSLYRSIGHRAALHYGTTKERWETGRPW
ncbi:hypothetical protein JCM10213_003262 [Rhodosporidiobolus nylandii]